LTAIALAISAPRHDLRLIVCCPATIAETKKAIAERSKAIADDFSAIDFYPATIADKSF
jgi:hypothetical protein